MDDELERRYDAAGHALPRGARIRALSLEDSAADAELVAEHLRADGWMITLKRVDTERDFVSELKQSSFDIVLSDYSLPQYDGLSALHVARRLVPDVPFLFVSGAIGEERAIETLRLGATDYVPKHRLERLGPAVQRAIRERNERALRRRAERERDRLRASEMAARRQAEDANRMKDEFLAVVSHELRTPLHAILGWASLLQSVDVDSTLSSRGLATIERNARMQARLIEDILDLSRVITGNLHLRTKMVPISAFVHAAADAVRPSADAKGIHLSIEGTAKAGDVLADPDRMQQVVWNLLTNAIKFTPRGGRVDVTVERTESHVAICVRDTGMGIDIELLPFVFDRFRQGDSSTTRTQGGLGLGLALVRHLVEHHGGTVHVRSRGLGTGAEFSMVLPIRPPVAGGEKAVGIHAKLDTLPALRGIRVLVVDDDGDSREVIAEVLRVHGASVAAASCAEDAQHAAHEFRPDVLVEGGALAAIALTALSRESDDRAAEAAGHQRKIPKPVDARTLIRAVSEMVPRRQNAA